MLSTDITVIDYDINEEHNELCFTQMKIISVMKVL